ncbi:hypothetical protein Agub_g15861, partial [Astrephomene gubernaculifera]
LRDLDATCRALQRELDSRTRLHDGEVRQLQQRAEQAEQRLRLATESYDSHKAQLAAQLSTAQQCLAELRRQCLEDVGLLQRRHGEEVAALRGALDAAAARGSHLEQEAAGLREQLRVAREEIQPRAASLEQQLAEERQAAEAAVAELQRRRQEAERRAQEAEAQRLQEVRALRAELEAEGRAVAHMRGELEALRAEAAAAAGMRGRHQRAKNGSSGGGGGGGDGKRQGDGRRVSEGAAAAAEAAAGSSSPSSGSEASLSPRVYHRRGGGNKGNMVMAGGGSSMGGPPPGLLAAGPVKGAPGVAAAVAPGGGEHAVPSMSYRPTLPYNSHPHQHYHAQLAAGRPAALSLEALQDSHDSLPDLGATSLMDLPPSPGSSASFWLGPSGGGAGGGGAGGGGRAGSTTPPGSQQ